MRIIVYILISLGLLVAQDKGKKAYEDGDFDGARTYYEHVLKNRKNDESAMFGLGASAYQQQDMETAAKSLNKAMRSKDKTIASKAMYNLGNMFRDQQKMDESLAFYRKAIELDPTDEDAKVNYELLKQVINQQQKQDQNSDQNSEEDENEKQDQESKDDQESEQNQSQNDQSEQNENQQNQQQEQKSQQGEDQKEPQQRSEQSQQKKPEEKSDKQIQAEAILNALKDQEKINQKRQISKAKSRKLEKDW